MLTLEEKKEIIQSFIDSNSFFLDRLKIKYSNYNSLDKSLLENRLSKEGLAEEIERISNVISTLTAYKNNISNNN